MDDNLQIPEMSELDQLLVKRGASSLDDHDRDRLSEILRSDDEALAYYIDHCQLHALLTGERSLLAELAGNAPTNILTMPIDLAEAEEFPEFDDEDDEDFAAFADAFFGDEDPEFEGDNLENPNIVDLETATVHDVPTPRATESKPHRKRIGTFWKIAALFVFSAVAASMFSNFRGLGIQVLTDGPDAKKDRSPQSEYEKTMEAIAAAGSGSQQRPPTTFISTTLPAEGEIRFNRDIRPILADACLSCHGPDSASRKADLRLDTKEGAFGKIPDSEAVPFVPGDPEKSEAFYRIITDDEDDLMPPKKSHKNITGEQKDLIKKWIETGAKWEEHWAFIPPVRPEIPRVIPALKKGFGDWSKNPIDALLLDKLGRRGLSPSPEADRVAQIRRVTLDLTGLPPTPEEVAAFVDDSAPDAYEKVVDRLLASPRFGEHRARYWLDAVRYGDTHGLHLDNFRSIWPYRDWIVRAFNNNLPFDQFTIEQIAGDLLPSPTEDQLIATGYNRCNPTSSEGGLIDKEYLSIYAKNRTDTTATVFMGLTMGCAGCHDHKFDPITQKDYYQMVAFFNNSEVPAKDGNKANHPPSIKIVPREQKDRAAKLDAEIASLRARLKATEDSARVKFAVWEKSISAGMFAEAIPTDGLELHLPLETEPTETETKLVLPPGATYVAGSKSPTALQLTGTGGPDLRPDVGDFEKDQPFSYGGWIKIAKGFKGSAGVFAKMDEKAKHRGWDLWVQSGNFISAHFIHTWSDNALKVTTQKPALKPDQWTHVFITYDGSAKPGGIRIYLDGVSQPHATEADALTGSIRTPTPLRLGQRSQAAQFTGQLDEFRLYKRALDPSEVAILAGSAHLKVIVKTPAEKRSDAQSATLFDYFVATQVPGVSGTKSEIASLETQRNALMTGAVTTLIMREKPGEAFAHILERGEYDQEKERVAADVPGVFSHLPDGIPRNRLALARWLVDPSHPLTARVNVNRFWQNVFGTGIVKTAEDFGVMGEPPSNPALLDWLAVEFRESGWDVKHIFRLMVTSAAYRQSAKFTEEHLEIDPANRYLARGSRYRLDAEALRDQALFVSGLLNGEIGGAPVKPYQPPGLWKVVAYPSSDTAKFVQDQGEKLYRRSLYTFWKRTSSPPNMTLFDAPDRESCTVRRERTNTPLQALVLMNDPQFVEASRHLAAKVLHDPNKATTGDRISAIYSIVLGGEPADKVELALSKSHRQFRDAFTKNPEGAVALINTGDSPVDESLDPIEFATWTLIANQILNTDAALNK